MCIHLYNYIQLAVLRRVYVRMHFVTPNEWYFVEDQVDQGGIELLLLIIIVLITIWVLQNIKVHPDEPEQPPFKNAELDGLPWPKASFRAS